MQDYRSHLDAFPSRSASPSPAIGHVHGLGESDALRVDLVPVQLPWLIDELNTLIGTVEEEHARTRARQAEVTKNDWRRAEETERELDRRSYQLTVLGMIREQLPLTDDVVAACVAKPWKEPNELARELARITAAVTVVGPARAMLVLIRGASRNVADALSEALRGPDTDPDTSAAESYALHWPECGRITGAVANRLRDVAAAAQAFTDSYATAVAQQSYRFDPEYSPIWRDELW